MSTQNKLAGKIMTAKELEEGLIVIHNSKPSIVVEKIEDEDLQSCQIELLKLSRENDFAETEDENKYNENITTETIYIDYNDEEAENEFIYAGYSSLYMNLISSKSMMLYYSVKSSVIDEITKEMLDDAINNAPEHML
jgi:hypothetical protein